jgi:hypothetical protein
MKRNPWLENLFRPLVIGVMFGCIALSVVELIRLFAPAWNATYLVGACVLAAVEANFSYRILRARPQRALDLLGLDAFRFRLIEIGVFVVLLKIGSFAGRAWPDVLADIQTWPRNPLNMIDAELVAACLLVALSWLAAGRTVDDLERLNDPAEFQDRYYVPPMESLAGRFFAGGIAVLVTSGLTRVGIAYVLNLSRPSVPGLVLNVLVYFLLGLVMLGQTHFVTLHKRWQIRGIKVVDELAGRWARYSVIFIGLAAFLAFLLPTGYTLGFLESIGGTLEIMIGVARFVIGLILLIVSLPIMLLLWLLGTTPPTTPSPLPMEFPPPGPAGGGADWGEVLRSLVFWLVLLGMIVYVLRSFLHERPELLVALGGLGPVRILRRWWAALRSLWNRAATAIGERMAGGLSLPWSRRLWPEQPISLFRLGALSPRERVLYYYLSIVRRAGERGFPRRRSQTPYEYDALLEPNLPHAQQDMASLTQAFVEARYSRRAVEPVQVGQIQTAWQRVKAALQALKRKVSQVGPEKG